MRFGHDDNVRQAARRLMLALAALGALGMPAYGDATSFRPSAAATAIDRENAPAPSGYYGFCVRAPDQCGDPGEGPSAIALSAETYYTLRQINQHFNDRIIPMDDLVHYGRNEYWTIPDDGYGDCEDYALAKRKALAANGIPISAMSLDVVRVPGKGRHVVLIVKTNRGDLVLDNRTNDLLAPDDTGYVWIEGQDAHQRWVWLQPPNDLEDQSVAATSQAGDWRD